MAGPFQWPTLQLLPCACYCIVLLLPSSLVQGATLYVNSKYPPPPPFVTSLYRAPQTYRADHAADTSRQRINNPYILVSKVRPCSVAANGDNARLVHNKLRLSGMRHNFTGPPPPPHHQHHHQPSMPSPMTIGAVGQDNFHGGWSINRPPEDHAQKEWPNRMVTYNEDGTRVLPESILTSHQLQPLHSQPLINDMTSSAVPFSLHDGSFISSPFGGTSDWTTSDQPPPRQASIGFLPLEVPTSQQWTLPAGAEEPVLITSAATTPATPTTRPVSATPADPTQEEEEDDDEEEEEDAGIEDQSTMSEEEDGLLTTDDTEIFGSIIDKLSGGAKNVLTKFLSGILKGEETQKNLNGKNKIMDKEETAEDDTSSTMTHGNDMVTVFGNSSMEGTDDQPGNGNMEKVHGQPNSQEKPGKAVLEDDSDNLSPTALVAEVKTSGDHPWSAVVTTPAAPSEDRHTTESYRYSVKCPQCVLDKTVETVAGGQAMDNNVSTSTTAWRPLLWPPIWSKPSPSEPRPPAPAATVVHVLSTVTAWHEDGIWNASTAAWNGNGTYDPSASAASGFDTEVSTIDTSGLTTTPPPPDAPFSTSIPRLPSLFLSEAATSTAAATTPGAVDNGKSQSPVPVIDWLLGASHERDEPTATANASNIVVEDNSAVNAANGVHTEPESSADFTTHGDHTNAWWNETAHVLSNDDDESKAADANVPSEARDDGGSGSHPDGFRGAEHLVAKRRKLYEKVRLGVPSPYRVLRAYAKVLSAEVRHRQEIVDYKDDTVAAANDVTERRI